MEDNKIGFKKKFNKITSECRQNAKPESCYYCGKKITRFCNSHSIPATFIKNIAVDGKVYSHNKLVQQPLLDEEKGVKKTGTFHLICQDCDSKIFRDYENPDNYNEFPTSKMLAQIAMKNYLKSISKRLLEIQLYDIANKQFVVDKGLYQQIQITNNLDLKENIRGFNRAKKLDKKGWGEYYLFYHQPLNYVVPLTFQSQVALSFDLEGHVINNIHNLSPDYRIQLLHICIFPLKNSSIIMMFIDSKDRRYRPFYRQFNKLSEDSKLAVVNYIILNLSEDIYFNKNADLDSSKLKDIVGKTLEIPEPTEDPMDVIQNEFDFSKMNELPNLLSEEFKVR